MAISLRPYGGTTVRHSSRASGQRGCSLQPVGGLSGLGTSPGSSMRLRPASTARSGTGTAESNALV